MKRQIKLVLSRLASAEAGQALIIVLVFLVLGSLTLVPALTYISTALKTGGTYEEKTNELYTADSGIEDGLWRIKYDYMGVDYEPYDFETTYTYETDEINGMAANFTVRNVWFPSDFTLDDWDTVGLTPVSAEAMIESGKLIVAGTSGVTPGLPYRVKIDFTPDVGDNLSVRSLGVWLPQGFDYISGNCSLLDDGSSAPYYPDFIDVTDVPGGTTVVWGYDEDPYYPLFAEFPDVASSNITMTLEFTFGYNPPAAHPNWLPLAVAWITTEMYTGSLGYPNTNDVPISWDVDSRFFQIVSEAGDTEVEAYSSRSELRQMGDAMCGDYVAIGGSLLSDDDNDFWGKREAWHTPSSFNLDSVPETADVAAAYLYWSGWRNDDAKQYVLTDACSDFTKWNRSSGDASQTSYPTGDVSHAGDWDVTTDMYTYVDEAGSHDGDTTYLLHGTSSGHALFSFPAFNVPSGSVIYDLTVYLVAMDTDNKNNKMQPAIRVDENNYLTESSSTEVPDSYTTISYVYDENPYTNNPWTAEDINGTGSHPLQAFGVYSVDASPQIKLTQVYAVVNYCESRWSISSGRFKGLGTGGTTTDAQRTLTLKNSLNLSSYPASTVVVYWDNYGSGNLDPDDALYFAFSNDGGASWGDDIEAYHGNPPTGYNRHYWYPVPADYLSSAFKIRLYFNLDDTSEYVQIDDFKVIYMEPDTEIVFKIDTDQVYFDGSTPSSGSSPLVASRYYTMFNDMNGVPEGYSYASVRDVTALLQKYPENPGEEHHTGNALYTVDEVMANTNNANNEFHYGELSNFAYAGWSLIVVYASPATAGHYIYIRDDNFAFHPGSIGSGSLDFDDDPTYPGGVITNFIIPNPIMDKDGNLLEEVAAKLTCFAIEGDDFGTSRIQITGEQSGKSMDLWNTYSPSPDVINSISYDAAIAEGVDIDTFEVRWDDKVDGVPILTPKDSRLYVDMYSSGDAWNLVYFIISIRSETVTSGTTHYVIHG